MPFLGATVFSSTLGAAFGVATFFVSTALGVGATLLTGAGLALAGVSSTLPLGCS